RQTTLSRITTRVLSASAPSSATGPPPSRRRRWGVRLTVVGVLAVAFGAAMLGNPVADAASATSNGWTTNAAVSATTVSRGSAVTMTVTVKSSTARSALIDVEVYAGTAKA